MDIIEGLMRFGLTRQESTLYVQLLTDKAMTGYEAAKATGISRSNAYTSLAGLVDKGAAYTIDGTPTRYTPVDAGEFLENKIRSLYILKQELMRQIPEIAEDAQAYITIRGTENIMNKVRSMLSGAKQRIYISGEYSMIVQYMDILKMRAKEGIKVVIITDCLVDEELLICHVASRKPGTIGVITDSEAVLTGEVTASDMIPTCLYSRKKNLVDLFKTSLSNEIKLSQIENTGI